MRYARVLVVTASLALGACTGGQGAPEPHPAEPARSTGDRHAPRGVLTAAPVPEGREEENSTIRKLLDLVARTPPGATIRITGNSFSLVPVAEALAEAHRRGVHVQVLIGRVSRHWKAPAVLRGALGTDRSADSFVRLTRGGLHQKMWSFSRTGRLRDVVLVGSMNLTYYSTGQYTDTFGFVGRRDVRRLFDRRFEQLLAQLPRPRPLSPASVGPDRVWFYPVTAGADPVHRMLARVPPQGARIRVAMYAWLQERGIALARLLAAKDAAGADVEVVLGKSVGARPRAILEASGVEVHEGSFRNGDDIHLKLTLVAHRRANGRSNRYVLTGSDNYTSRSLTRPEVLLRLDGGKGRRWHRYTRLMATLVERAETEARG